MRLTCLLASILIASLIVGMIQIGTVFAPTTVFVDPPQVWDQTLTPSSEFTIKVNISDVTDLYAWGLYLSWNPDLLNTSVTDIVEGPFLKGGPEGTAFAKKVYNLEGYVDLGCTIIGDYKVSGSGTLVSITLTVKAVGECILNLYDSELINYDLEYIPYTEVDGYFFNKVSSAITINASPDILKIGTSTTLSGSITPTKIGVNVTIWYKLSGETAWNALTNTTTNSESKYSYMWTPAALGTYELKANWTGDATALPAESGIATVSVVTKLPPTASFTYSPASPKVGETATFNASASSDLDGTIANCTWDFGDETSVITETNFVVDHIYTNAGDYTVTLNVTDNDGLSDIATTTITIGKLSSTITISVTQSSFTLGESTTISGTITPARVGVMVTISYRLVGASWSVLAIINTNDTSQYYYSFTPTATGIYELKSSWPGDANTLTDESDIVTVTVEKTSSTITINASPDIIKIGATTTISGAITPTRVGATVTIQHKLSTATTWTTLTTANTNSTSQYAYPWTPQAAGTYELRAVWTGDANTKPAESETKTLNVEEQPSMLPTTLYAIGGIVIAALAAIVIYLKKFRKPR